MSVINLANVKDDNTLISPEQTLLDALDEIKSGKRPANKVLILTLYDEDKCYGNGFYASNMKASEMVTLCFHSAGMFSAMLDGE